MGKGIEPCPCPRLRNSNPSRLRCSAGQKHSNDNGDPNSSSRPAWEPLSHRVQEEGRETRIFGSRKLGGMARAAGRTEAFSIEGALIALPVYPVS